MLEICGSIADLFVSCTNIHMYFINLDSETVFISVFGNLVKHELRAQTSDMETCLP